MDPLYVEVIYLFAEFNVAFGSENFPAAIDLITQLKVLLTKVPSLPPFFEDTYNASAELFVARAINEQAVALSTKMRDEKAFERNFCQLKPYYTDTRRLLTSSRQYAICSQNLLMLLAQNRIAEFHQEPDLLTADALQDDDIKHVIELEQNMMIGAYNRVLIASYYTVSFFIERLLITVRDEIVCCIEKAYDCLSLEDAKEIFMVTDDQMLLLYIQADNFSSIDILSACNLVNYFGKMDLGGSGVGQITIYPVLIRKVRSACH